MRERAKQRRQGAVMTFLAVGLVVMLCMFALVIDVGMLFRERSQLTNAADAGALAGALELKTNLANAPVMARLYARQNDQDLTDANIDVNTENYTYTALDGTSVTIPNGRINVTITKDKGLFFAKFLGVNTAPVRTTASAAIMYYGGGKGIVPFGITEDVLTTMTEPGGSDGRYVIKFGPQPPTDAELLAMGYPPASTFKGNFGALALGGSGASVYSDNIKYGSTVNVGVGSTISTEPGVMSGPTDRAVDYRINLDPGVSYNNAVANGSSRIVLVPVIDPGVGDISGRTDVVVQSFVAVFLEDFQPARGNGGYVIARFVEGPLYYESIGGGSTDTGLYTYRLVN